ncbi:NAD(P)/FAD-dependent oxidoreductase [Salinibacter altiplanensis]|uniref:NAD(P)/FAD-dependent oxidoreductase n=1 Tax=Salinibacter altiplanensis TaxID=1803181 RepID=UPI000C9F1982|nr:FAD-dependent oxidoreductase [Salinibacter altiplanensis]
MTARLGTVGAGAGAAAATYVTNNALPDAEITVFEKSRGVCGRAAARRRDGLVYEHGANYLTDDDDRVNNLVTEEFDDGLVEVNGPIWTFDAAGTVSEGRDSDKRRWTYADGITRLAKHLFGATGATVKRTTRIVDVHHDGGWRLTDANESTHGPFDTLLLNPPAPQTAALLDETGIEAVDQLGNAAAAVDYRTVWTAVLGYDFEIDVPYYALVNADKEHAVGWIGREECKPGHVPDGETVLVVQASPDWSTERYDDPPEQNIAVLAQHAAEIVGDERLTDPDWTDHQGWRYALPEAGVRADAVRAAAQKDVYVTGDWVAGEARLHAAVRNGLGTGDAVAEALRGR